MPSTRSTRSQDAAENDDVTQFEMESTMATFQPNVVFKGQDFQQWLRRITLILRSRGLEITIKSQSGGSERDRTKALEIIVNHLDNSVYRLIQNDDSPFQLLNELKARYGELDSAAIVALRSKLAGVRLNDFKSAKDYVDEVTNLVIRLESAGEEVSAEQHYAYLLQGLNERYDNVRAAAAAVLHVKRANPEIARSLILQEDQRRGQMRYAKFK